MAPWAAELVDQFTNVNRESLPGGSGVSLESAGHRLVVSKTDTRKTHRAVVDPSLLVPCGEAWFDVRDWLDAVDGGDHADLRGEAQTEVVDRLDEFAALQSAELLTTLRQARDRFVTAQGRRAIHGPAPEWPVEVAAPRWMSVFDEVLLAEGFDSGWCLDAGPGQPIGVVRQRGGLRIQTSVLDDQALVQVAVWPHQSWTPLSSIAAHFATDADLDDPAQLLSLAERAADTVFAPGDRLLRSRNDRQAAAESQDGFRSGSGPGGHFEYFLLSGAPIERWVQLPEYDELIAFENAPETAAGGRFVKAKAARNKDIAKAPGLLRTMAAEWWADTTLAVLDQVAPDAHLFEIDVDGRAFYRIELPGASRGDLIDDRRSVSGWRARPPQGGFVVDPRKVGRPGHLLATGDSILGDLSVVEAVATVSPMTEIYPTWDDEGIGRISIRKFLTGRPDPEPEPFVVRGPLPESERPDLDVFVTALAAGSDSYETVARLFAQVNEWYASHRDWDGLDTFTGAAISRVLEAGHLERVVAQDFGSFADECAAMIDGAIGQARDDDSIKAFFVGLYHDGEPGERTSIFLCQRDESISEDWPAYFETSLAGPALHRYLGPWLAIYEREPGAANVGYYGTYSRIVSATGRIWQQRQPQQTPLAIDDRSHDLVYL